MKKKVLAKVVSISAICALILVMAAGCSTAATGTAAVSPKAPAAEAATSEFQPVKPPAELAMTYVESPLPVTTSAYAKWKAKKGPYVIGFANGTMGPTWRAQSLQDMQDLFNEYKQKGIVSKLIVVNADNNVTTQIAQINDMIAQKVDLILINPISETATNPVIEKAFKAGIPVVSFNNFVSSPYAQNVGINQILFANMMAQGLVDMLHGKGNIVMMNGIPGQPSSTIREKAANKIFAQYPDIKVIASTSGNFSDSQAKAAMLNVIATHPQKIDAVWQSGVMAQGILEALEQSGRPIVPISADGQYNFVQYWHEHPEYKTVGAMDPPTESTLGLRVGLRILQGQHPLMNLIINDPPALNAPEMKKYFKPNQPPTSWVDPSPTDYMTEEKLNSYFENGKPIE
ncbi:substrate-binding domain-containing protein [Paenibacillus sp. sptzw28]|uniref:substrate-binding domain-containing protein n=1 Tax=Paenibacillus sp. sptzw28 TaxID=715179 RepID=UPI001C6E1FE7|nr:substrate-binding domain-containing protein [Paenibacillus sp. sptzw28]QYR21796.1 substrate-binding domain-containing protein [Paenibacillus sp. sptzw28]